jgi:hypothetical protein
VLSWFDEQGNRYPSAEEQAQRALIQVQQAQIEAQQAQVEAQQAQVEAQRERQARLEAIPHLHQMGLSEEQIAAALGLPLSVVQGQLN